MITTDITVKSKKIFYKRSTNSAVFLRYSECPNQPLPFYATQMINPLLNSEIITNYYKG